MERFGSNKELLYVLAGAVVGFALLALYAFSQPATRTGSNPLKYTQRASFAYTAKAAPGIYEGDVVVTGNPIFVDLVEDLRFVMNYNLDGSVGGVSGTYRVLAEVAGNGLRRSLFLAPETPFSGPSFTADVPLDLRRVREITDVIEQQIGVGGNYTVAIVPQVAIQGNIGGQQVRDVFAPRLEFAYANNQFTLTSLPEELSPTQDSSFSSQTVAPNSVALGPLVYQVENLRSMAVLGLIVSLVLLGVYLLARDRLLRDDEMERIQQKYGSLLIPVQGVNFRSVDRVVEVDTIDNLANIAMALERPILTVERDGDVHFVVQDGGVVYHTRSGKRASSLVTPPTPTPTPTPTPAP
ncbi:MAG: hypothetical protein RLZZ387_1277 [Chloroflexota bacterium]|jgi:hypothetical protein